jgi:PRTRC genetic system protein E
MTFETFFQMLLNDERIQFTVARKGDQLSVLVQPVLRGAVDDNAPEHIQTLRAALSMPLYVETSPTVLDRDFPRSLAEFAGTRETIRNDLRDALDRLNEAGKQARVAADKASPAAQAPSGARANDRSAASVPAEQAASVSVTEKSLF